MKFQWDKKKAMDELVGKAKSAEDFVPDIYIYKDLHYALNNFLEELKDNKIFMCHEMFKALKEIQDNLKNEDYDDKDIITKFAQSMYDDFMKETRKSCDLYTLRKMCNQLTPFLEKIKNEIEKIKKAEKNIFKNLQIQHSISSFLSNRLKLYHEICGNEEEDKTEFLDNSIILLNAMEELKNDIELSQMIINEWNLFNEIDEGRNEKKQQIIDQQMRELDQMMLNNNNLKADIAELNFNLQDGKSKFGDTLSGMENFISHMMEQNKLLEKAYYTAADKYDEEFERSNDSIKNLNEELRKKEKELNESKKEEGEEKDNTKAEIENLKQQLIKMKEKLNESEKNKEDQKEEDFKKKKELEDLKNNMRETLKKLVELKNIDKNKENLEEEIKWLKNVVQTLENDNNSLYQEMEDLKKKKKSEIVEEKAKKSSGETKTKSKIKTTQKLNTTLEKMDNLVDDGVNCAKDVVLACLKYLDPPPNWINAYRSGVTAVYIKQILYMLLDSIKSDKTIKEYVKNWLKSHKKDMNKMYETRVYIYFILDNIGKECTENYKNINQIVKQIFSEIKNYDDKKKTSNLLDNKKKPWSNVVNKLQ